MASEVAQRLPIRLPHKSQLGKLYAVVSPNRTNVLARTRYRKLIASGTQTTALMLGLTAAHFTKDASMVGLEYCVKFRRPVFADETIPVEWLVIKVAPNARLGGDIVELRGRVCGEDGQTAVGAKGRVLVTNKL